MREHTPQPWIASDDPTSDNVYVKNPISDLVICEVGSFVIGPEIARANAELIARAPELQEQVTELVAALEKALDALYDIAFCDHIVPVVYAEQEYAEVAEALAKHQEEEVKPYNSLDEVLEDITGIKPKPQEEN